MEIYQAMDLTIEAIDLIRPGLDDISKLLLENINSQDDVDRLIKKLEIRSNHFSDTVEYSKYSHSDYLLGNSFRSNESKNKD